MPPIVGQGGELTAKCPQNLPDGAQTTIRELFHKCLPPKHL